MIGTNDLPRAAAFHDRLLALLGARRVMELERLVARGTGCSAAFGGKSHSAAARRPWAMIALQAANPEMVDRVHAEALELGGS